MSNSRDWLLSFNFCPKSCFLPIVPHPSVLELASLFFHDGKATGTMKLHMMEPNVNWFPLPVNIALFHAKPLRWNQLRCVCSTNHMFFLLSLIWLGHREKCSRTGKYERKQQGLTLNGNPYMKSVFHFLGLTLSLQHKKRFIISCSALGHLRMFSTCLGGLTKVLCPASLWTHLWLFRVRTVQRNWWKNSSA